MHMKFYWILLVMVSLTIKVMGQGPQLTNVIPPSPNMQAMEKYGDIPVSTYTGIPNISIPLYTVKFRDITIPISLSYHASGIKVDEEASQVGLGWVLNAGGSISRKIIGGDDFNGNYLNANIPSFEKGFVPTQLVQLGDKGWFYNIGYPHLPTIYDSSLSTFVDNGQPYDLQPDEFYFNIPGHIGKFILDHDDTVYLQNQKKLLITYASDGSSFEIQTEEGFSYNFLQYDYYNNNGSKEKSAWYLTSVISPLGSVVTFNYTVNTDEFIQTIGGYSESRDDYTSLLQMGYSGISFGDQQGPTPGHNYSIVTLSSIDFTNGIVKFSYSNNRKDTQDEQRLDSIRVYEKNKSGLIEAFPIKTIIFNYGYFKGNVTTSPYDTLAGYRLMLEGLQTIGTYNVDSVGLKDGYYNSPDSEGAYRFTYYDSISSDILPSKTSFARDHWGYYNGKNSNTSLIPTFTQLNIPGDFVLSEMGTMGTERDADTNFVRAFSLKDIFYPTGGTTEFQYESNDFDVAKSEINDKSFYANEPVLSPQSQALLYDGSNKGIIYTDTLNLTDQYLILQDTAIEALPVSVNAAFRFVGGTGGNCNDVNIGNGQVYYELDDIFGKTIDHVDVADLPLCTSNGNQAPCIGCQSGSPVFTYTRSFNLGPGKYVWKAYCANSGNALKLEDIHATFSWYTQVGSQVNPSDNPKILNYAFGGGIRIRNITDYDGIGGSKTKTFIYHYSEEDSSNNIYQYSFGRIMEMPRYGYFQIEQFIMGFVTPDGEIDYTGPITHLMRSAETNLPLDGSGGGMAVGYDQVIELDGPNGRLGKIEYKFSNQPDFIPNYNIDGFPMRPPYNSGIANKYNGDLLDQTEYQYENGQYYPVHEVENIYNTYPATENEIYGLEKRSQINRKELFPLSGPPSMVPDTLLPNQLLLYFYPALQSEWHYLRNKTEKTYDINDSSKYMVNTVNYYYNNSNHYQLTGISTTDSKGETVITTLSYPLDFSGLNNSDPFSKGIQTLETSHVVNAIIEKYVQKMDTNFKVETIFGFLNSYEPASPLPALIYKSEPSKPIFNFTPAYITSSGVKMDSNYNALIYLDLYDPYGNILQQHKAFDLSQSYIWDYNNSLPIATAVNAISLDIAYSSFESNGTGNWRINDTSRNYSNSFTGVTCFVFNGSNDFISDSSLSTTKQYIVSYWSMNGSITVSNSGSFTTGSTKNGWTYFEHKLTSGVSSVKISGAGKIIDELRLFPVDAQMTTYTYDPLIGITSSCSPNNIVSYYLYDALGRLHGIKDQDGNIIKTIDYNYKY
jgi:hypothetical protein